MSNKTVLILSVLLFQYFCFFLRADDEGKKDSPEGKIISLCSKFKFKEALEEYNKFSSLPDVSEQARADMSKHIIKALNEKKDAEITKIKKKSDSLKKHQLKLLKEELNKLRKDALKFIFDMAAYPDGSAGKSVQPKVDEKINAIREIWDNPSPKPADMPKDVVRALDEIGVIDDCLEILGTGARKEDGLLKAVIVITPEDIRGYALNGTEKELAEYNGKICEANENRVTVMSGDEMAILKKTNEYRDMMGLKVLGANDLLAKAARKHIEWCVKRGAIDHIQDVAASRTPQDRANQEGYKNAVGENLHQRTAVGDVVQAAFNGWYNSPEHHRTMLREWNELGMGLVVSGSAFSAQVFGSGDSAVLKYPKKNDKAVK